MLLYFVCALLSSFFLMTYLKKRKYKFFLVLAFLPLFFISAFRYGIGFDYLRIYVPMFNFVISGVPVEWDIGIIYLCKFISLFSYDYIWFFVLTSFITMYYFFKGFLTLSDSPVFLLLLFVFSGEFINSLNAVRQYMALAIFVYSIKFILEKNWKKYFIYIFIASLFHNSALMLLPIYFLPKLKLGVKKQFLFIILTVISLPLISRLFYFLINFTKYTSYLGTGYDTFDPSYSELIMSVIVYFVSVLFYKKFSDDKKFMLFFNLMLIYLIISILSFKIILAFRLVIYFRIFQIFILAHISSKLTNKKFKYVFNFMLLLFFASITCIGGYVFGWYDVNYMSVFNGR